jgi:glutathione peroxidase
MRFAVLIFVGVATTAGHDPVSSLATRRVALARAAAVAGTGLWRSAVLAEDSAAAAASEAYDASAVAPEVLPPPAPPAPPAISAFDFDVPFRGEPREITPFLGRANLLVNVKFDDPETLDQMPAIGDMVSRYSERGLHVLAFPTDQGWFEADDSNTLRLKYKSVYGFGQYPTAVVFDKADLLGGNALPLYTWMTTTLSNPWGVNRLVFNYEKFLVDDRGQPRRRYPRKFPIQLMDADVRTARCWRQRPPAAVRRGTRPMHPPFHLHPPSPTCLVTERDWPFAFPRAFVLQVQALLNGQPLPPPSASLEKAWEDAKREAVKSEYSFKPGLVRVAAAPTSLAPSSHR